MLTPRNNDVYYRLDKVSPSLRIKQTRCQYLAQLDSASKEGSTDGILNAGEQNRPTDHKRDGGGLCKQMNGKANTPSRVGPLRGEGTRLKHLPSLITNLNPMSYHDSDSGTDVN